MSASKTIIALVITCLVTMLVGTANAEARPSRSGGMYKSASSQRSNSARNNRMATNIMLNIQRNNAINQSCAKKVMKRELARAEKQRNKQQKRIMRSSEAKIKEECMSL